MTFVRGIVAALRNRRIVSSGSPPLYWQLLFAAIISGVLQFIGGTPESVSRSANGSTAVDYMFCALQLSGAVIALFALHIEDGSSRHAERLYWSLAFEAFGLVLMVTTATVYAAAVTIANHGPPTSMATWFVIAFGYWSIRTRLPQIIKALRELKS